MSSGTNPPSSTGRRLREALTQEQIESLLDVISDAGLLAGLDDLLRAADPDLADTIRRVHTVAPTTPTVTPSDQKALETWQSLWGTWQDCISELGDENGKYSNHEERWHPPYFDPYALSEDLDKAAEEMLPWIERVFPLAEEPDLFEEAFAEIGEGILAYPEWMQGGEDGCDLGPQTTACTLNWIWCGLADQETPGRCFVDRIQSVESKYEHVRLSTEAIFDFLKNLQEEICREIHAHLRSPAFFSVLSDTRSVWHQIQRDYDKRFDTAAFLATCEEHLSSDWHYGEPLISDAQSRGHLAKAEEFIKFTMTSLLNRTSDEPWIPEERLIPRNPYAHSPDEDSAVTNLIEQWELIAAKRGDSARLACCRLQRTLWTSPENWTETFQAFEEFKRGGGKRSVADSLLEQWRETTVQKCPHNEETRLPVKDCWVSWLIEARFGAASKTQDFFEQMDAWIQCCLEHPAFFNKHWRSLALLTQTVPNYPRIKEEYPTFHSHALTPATRLSPNLIVSIREAFEFLCELGAVIDPMPAWREHLHRLVSVPGANGSYYRDQALWMKALSEINNSSYEKTLAKWRIEFRRRRNLWAEMASVKCPGC